MKYNAKTDSVRFPNRRLWIVLSVAALAFMVLTLTLTAFAESKAPDSSKKSAVLAAEEETAEAIAVTPAVGHLSVNEFAGEFKESSLPTEDHGPMRPHLTPADAGTVNH